MRKNKGMNKNMVIEFIAFRVYSKTCVVDIPKEMQFHSKWKRIDDVH